MKPLLYSHFFPPDRNGIETTVSPSAGGGAGHSATDGGCELKPLPRLRKVITTIVGPGAMGEGYGVSACRRIPHA